MSHAFLPLTVVKLWTLKNSLLLDHAVEYVAEVI